MVQQCVKRGKGNVLVQNKDGHLPVHLAAAKNHTHVMHYLDVQSCDLSSMCRQVIHQAMGKKCELNKLHLPPRLKLFLRYSIPYPGLCMVVVPAAPWTAAQLYQNEVKGEELREFIVSHASEDFIEEHASLIGKRSTEDIQSGDACDQELVRLFQEMYLWDAFKPIEYEEPLPRQPRYSMERTKPPSSAACVSM